MLLTPSPTVGPRPWRLVGLRNRAPRACARGGAHRIPEADTLPHGRSPSVAGVASSFWFLQHQGLSKSAEGATSMLVQNAKFHLQLAEVLVFNAARHASTQGTSRPSNALKVRSTAYLGDLLTAALGRSPSVTLQVESDPRDEYWEQASRPRQSGRRCVEQRFSW